jgi:endonuclease YncB( thermonuclease family)
MRRVLLVVVLALLRPRASPERGAARQDDRSAVAHVVDGDTFRGGDDRKVRLIGVDTPEQGQGEAGRLARQALLAFLPLGGPYTVPPDVKYAERFRRAQKEARARRVGLWARGGFDCLPRGYRRNRCLTRS